MTLPSRQRILLVLKGSYVLVSSLVMRQGESAPSLPGGLQTNLVDVRGLLFMAAVMDMQKNHKALPRLTYTSSHPNYLVCF